jgi:hypothetical protein
LHHPVYAGAYVYGRRETNPKKVVPGKPSRGRRWAKRDDWDVLIQDKLPAYITWDQWEKNQEKLCENSAKYRAGGAPRGTSLLAGRVICGRCGRRMSICYSGQKKARFTCDMSRNQWGDRQCQSFNARPLHELVERVLLTAVSPASLELNLAAAQQIESDREGVARHHRQTVERARYQSELARGRYEAVNHDCRLVASELERRWEAALLEQRKAEEELDRVLQQHPTRLTAEERKRISSLAIDIPALWNAKSTSGIDRQMILRTLIDQVLVEVRGNSERVAVTIRWSGGFESHHEIRRPVGKFEQLEAADEIRSRIIALKQQGYPHHAVARHLNDEHFHSASGGPFTVPIVSQLCRKFRAESHLIDKPTVPGDRWKLGDLAKHLRIKPETLSTWRRRGWLYAEKIGQRWILWADAEELNRLQQLAEHGRKGLIKTPSQLTIPRRRPR